MHTTKKLYSKTLVSLALLGLTSVAFANDPSTGNLVNSSQSESMRVLLKEPGGLGYAERNTYQKTTSGNDGDNSTGFETVIPNGQNHDKHLKEHGGQIFQTTKFENEWTVDEDGKGALGSKIETLIGTDENRLFIEANDPDDAKLLSDVTGAKIDEVFIGSCMTNIGHFRAAGKLLEKVEGGSLSTRLWLAPPTRMDEHQLMEEGYYNIYGRAGARTEMPGCSLCMGNQARVAPNTTCVSTSTRNFPNRLGQGANVYLASAELASVAAVLGRLPTVAEYMEYAQNIDSMAGEIYRYMNFDRMGEYTAEAGKVDTKKISAAQLT